MSDKRYRLINADCVDAMRQLPADSIDSIVCDPPYGISFMEDWDDLSGVKNANRGTLTNMVNEDGSQKFRTKAPAFDLSITGARAMQDWHFAWAKEALRVLKPGGFLFAFGGSRTVHRLACAIEDAGLEIRDSIIWNHAQGFPKSLDVSKAINQHLGPDNDAARQWKGFGTALKPSQEIVVISRKNFEGTVAENVLKHGTGALNINACRIATKDNLNGGAYSGDEREKGGAWQSEDRTDGKGSGFKPGVGEFNQPEGRWPSNTIFSHSEDCSETKEGWKCAEGCPVQELDRQSGELKSGKMVAGQQRDKSSVANDGAGYNGGWPDTATLKDTFGDSGGASRFFFTSKSSPDEKFYFCRTCNIVDKQAVRAENPDCPMHGDNPKTKDYGPLFGGKPDTKCVCWSNSVDAHKGHDVVVHVTVKPLEIMKFLCRLSTRPGGLILDPFLGTGTTGVAALQEGFRFIGIERDADYFKICTKRIETEGR